MDVVEFAEKVLGLKLEDCQKKLLKAVEKSDNEVLISCLTLRGNISVKEILEKYRESEFAYVRIF
jgi:hypothetical protein